MNGLLPVSGTGLDQLVTDRNEELRREARDERLARGAREHGPQRRNGSMRLLRNLGRRKVRSTLTILGIAIGIWALVVFGSMANKIDALVAGGSDYYAGKIVVSAAGGMGGLGGPMAISTGDRIARLPGVDIVVAGATLTMSDTAAVATMGPPPVIVSALAGRDGGRETFKTTMASGRAIGPEDAKANVVTLGSDTARKYRKQVGDTIQLRGEPFTVIGILEPTLTAPDTSATVPLAAAQRLYLDTLPPLVASKLVPSEVATSLVVYLDPGADPAVVADAIRASIPGVSPMTGADFDQQIGSAMAVLDSILVGIALISLVVGGLSVINTMAMSIAERTREIGIKRAIGGSRTRIVRELVVESACIGFIGGAIGLAFGAALVVVANEAGRGSGTILFSLTAGTACSALAFSTVLGALAGLVPALNAARLDPVTALRYE